MIDYRHETFFALCRIRSYTKTAEHLHVTQPAVSQHIRHLEELYGGSLFEYKDRKLYLTERAERLYAYLQVLRADSGRLKTELTDMSQNAVRQVRFGATLTIGEYVMPEVLEYLIKEHPSDRIHMVVENTKHLTEKLQGGQLDFALIEGYFDKSQYSARRISTEQFIPVCSPQSSLKGKTVSFEELWEQRLILREIGSGTREVFEKTISDHNYSLQSFHQISEIGNMNVIKRLVSKGAGISFMYLQAAKEELLRGELSEFQIRDFSAKHEFNFVTLQNSVFEPFYMEWYRAIRKLYTRQEKKKTDEKKMMG